MAVRERSIWKKLLGFFLFTLGFFALLLIGLIVYLYIRYTGCIRRRST